MESNRLGARRSAAIGFLSALTLGIGLGGSSRLSYHEAIVAQGAREMLGPGGDWLVPTLAGRPWLEKPPLSHWLVATSGALIGEINETVARIPSAVSALLICLGVATLAARRFGAGVGWLSGLVQATTLWLVTRGRLAEADVVLACLITWAVVAFDRIRERGPEARAARWAFFFLLGATALAKGVGFGGVLVLAMAVVVLAWDRDRETARALIWPLGGLLASVLALAWPAMVAWRYPSVMGLWMSHVTDRLSVRPEQFAGEPWWQYAPSPFWMVLPWTPLAMGGAWRSWRRAVAERGGPDRLLWAWAVVPASLVSLASVRNAHYLIHALPPWSVWGALGLVRLGERLRGRGWSADRLRRVAALGVSALGLAWGLGFALVGPRIDRRGVEWAFYERAGRSLRPAEPLALLYDAPGRADRWDRDPYPTPFGPVPHDLAVRLFYLGRPACWRLGVDALAVQPPGPAAFAVIGRDRDLSALQRLGRVETLAQGPTARWDRIYRLYRVEPKRDQVGSVTAWARESGSAPSSGLETRSR